MTLIRDVPSLGGENLVKKLTYTFLVQFAVFEGSKEAINSKLEESSFSSFVAGGFSVLLAWIVAYPQDTIKTKIQCSKTELGMIECTKEIYKTTGFAGFWKGLSPCLLRAIVTGATRYIAYDKCQELIGNKPEY